MNNIPTSLTDKIKTTIHEQVRPKMNYLIAKLFAIHIATAVITLSVCPQFGIRAFKSSLNLMHTFMVFGLPVCNFLCGVFFTATSIGIASVILKRDEIRALKFNKTLTSASLILSSVGFFSIMNPNLFLEFSLLWLLGALFGIVVTLETTSRFLSRA